MYNTNGYIGLYFDKRLIWEDHIRKAGQVNEIYDNILLFLSDATPYMVKAREVLKIFY